MNDDNRTRMAWLLPIIMALASLAISGMVAYSQDRETDRVDAAIVTTQQKNDHDRLERLEIKVDEILRAMRQRP